MNGFELYIVNNFPLLLIAIGMFFVVFYDSRMRTKTGFFTIGIVITAILLSIFGALSDGLAAYTDLPDNAQIICATVFSFFGYITRPLVIYYFILIAADRKRKEALLNKMKQNHIVVPSALPKALKGFKNERRLPLINPNISILLESY